MEYFNTFGGNPVSCAISLAVLEAIESEEMMRNARVVGQKLLDDLVGLQRLYPIVGNVRGLGLFVGIELVATNRLNLEPATDAAKIIVEKMKDLGILISTDGPFNNVLKFKPPIVFTSEDADFFVQSLDLVLSEIN